MLNKVFDQLKQHGVEFWYRYVDDTFVLLKDKNNADLVLQFLNNIHKNLRFTTENEKNKMIPFLDVLVERKSFGFKTTIYRKKTYTGVLLNWNSLTSRKYKINLIKCLLDRIWKICSDYELINIEIIKLKQILLNNDYPLSIIDDEIYKFINNKYKIMENLTHKQQEDLKTIYLVLPYLNSKVEEFGFNLENLIKKFYKTVKLKVVFETANDIGKCFPFKESLPKHMQSHVVYHLKCLDCDADYIGKTSRQIERRFEEHKSGSKNEDTYDSSCFEHEKKYNHTIDYDNFKILDKATTDQMVLIKEMLHIDRLKPSLNKQKQSHYTCLILGSKKKKNI